MLLQDWFRQFDNFGIRRQLLPWLLSTLKGKIHLSSAIITSQESFPFFKEGNI